MLFFQPVQLVLGESVRGEALDDRIKKRPTPPLEKGSSFKLPLFLPVMVVIL